MNSTKFKSSALRLLFPLRLVAIAALIPTVNVLIFQLLRLYPSHDSLVFAQKMYAISQSLHYEGSFITYLPNIRFGVSASALDTVSVEAFPVLLFGSIFDSSPHTIFIVYYITSSVLLGLIWWKIFCSLNIQRHIGQVGMLIVGTINYPLWQVWFNFQIFFQGTYLLLALIVLATRDKNRWFIFISMNILFIPLGHPFYFSIFFFYLEIAMLMLMRRKILPLNDFGVEFKRPSILLFLIVYTVTFLYIVIKNLQILSSQARVISPGERNFDGSVTFKDFLTYGGQSGSGKMVSLLGEKIPGSLDFSLFTSMLAVPVFVLVLLSNLEKKTTKFPLPLISIIIGLTFVTYPTHFLSLILYEVPGMNYLRHLAFFSATIKPFVLLMTIIAINSFNREKLKRLMYLTVILYAGVAVSKGELYSIILLLSSLLILLLLIRQPSTVRMKKDEREKFAKLITIGVLVISNWSIFFVSNPTMEAKLPLIDIYKTGEQIELDKDAKGPITSKYLNLSTTSKMTTYDALALQLKSSYCLDLRYIKDANNAPVRSDIEAIDLQRDRAIFEEICQSGGARFLSWDGNNLKPVDTKFQLSVTQEKTVLNYIIEDYDHSKKYFVELAQTRWEFRNESSKLLKKINVIGKCDTCISIDITKEKGQFIIESDFGWKLWQSAYFLLAFVYFVLSVIMVFTNRSKMNLSETLNR